MLRTFFFLPRAEIVCQATCFQSQAGRGWLGGFADDRLRLADSRIEDGCLVQYTSAKILTLTYAGH